MTTPIPTFTGEVQLRRWSESSTQGVQVTFALADADDLEPLKAKSGKRFMAVLVEIGDDEQAVEPPMGPLCKWVVLRCNEPEFWKWLSDEAWGTTINGSEAASNAVKSLLNIGSRKDIDGDSVNEANFHRLIRGPYNKWCLRRGVTA